MGCWVHGVLGALCAVCAGCWVRGVHGLLGAWGAGCVGCRVLGRGKAHSSTVWPCHPCGDAGGHGAVTGLTGHQPTVRADGARRAHHSPRHAGGRWLFGDGHTSPVGRLAPTGHPQPRLTAQPRHPPPCLPYEAAPCAEAGDGTSITGETRCQHRPGAAALPNQRKAPAGAAQPQPQRQEHPTGLGAGTRVPPEHPNPLHAAAVIAVMAVAADDPGDTLLAAQPAAAPGAPRRGR